jgi:hypothetical protein
LAQVESSIVASPMGLQHLVGMLGDGSDEARHTLIVRCRAVAEGMPRGFRRQLLLVMGGGDGDEHNV